MYSHLTGVLIATPTPRSFTQYISVIDGNRRAIALDELFLEGLHTMLGKLVDERRVPRRAPGDCTDRGNGELRSVGQSLPDSVSEFVLGW